MTHYSNNFPCTPCPDCAGEGYLIDYYGPARFDPHQECWLPSEVPYPCDSCQGTGEASPAYEHDELDDRSYHPATAVTVAPDAHLEEQYEGFYEPELPF